MKPLERIRIEGFKSIHELKLDIRPLNILIGANGSGKSNFISVFNLLSAAINQRLQAFVAQAGGASKLLHFGPKETEQILIEVWLDGESYAARLRHSDDDALYYHIESWEGPGGEHPLMPPQSGSAYGLESGLVDEDAFPVVSSIRSWKVYHFHDTSRTAAVKQTGHLHDNTFLRPDGANLAAFLYRLREAHPGYYRQIVRSIRLAAPFFEDFALRPNPLNPDTIRLEWQERGSDAYFDASMLSDGTLRFICLATLLLQPDLPSVLLIDEPELGLHPYALNLLAGLLQSAAVHTRVIAATQSVPLVNNFNPEDLVVVDRKEGRSLFVRPDPDELRDWLEDYTLGQLWEKNIIGGRPQR